MVCGQVLLLLISASCIAVESANFIEDGKVVKECAKESGVDMEQREDVLFMMVRSEAEIEEPKKEGKCLLFCLAHKFQQVDENGKLLPGKFDDVTPMKKDEIKKCEEEGDKYQDKCERVYRMIMCARKSHDLYWAVRDVIERDHFTRVE